MLWLPIIFLTLALLVVGTAFALMFCGVAFAGWNGGTARPSAGWELPTMSGERLRDWAASLARRVVARHARQPRSAETPLSIATELEAGANAVLEQAAQRANTDVAKSCPNTRPHQIAVTAPEVFGIVDELERRYSQPEIQMVRELAVMNARRGRFMFSDEFAQAGIKCPLQTNDGHCLTFTNRPLACRRLCSNCPCATTGCGDRCKDGTAASSAEVAAQLHDGMTHGLSEGLREAGLDDGVYELNDALATALAAPHAASRWSRGEAVFANCAKA